MSKQVIAQIQQQLLKPQVIVFAQIKLKIQKTDPKSELVKVVDIFLKQTYDTLKAKKIDLPPKFLKKIRLLSILSYFYQLNNYNLLTLGKQLDLGKEECMQLLIEANIYKLIAVHIDEERNIITIRRSKIRQRQVSQNIVSLSSSKINIIKAKNNNILNNIEKLSILNGQQPKQKQLEYKSSFSSSLFRP